MRHTKTRLDFSRSVQSNLDIHPLRSLDVSRTGSQLQLSPRLNRTIGEKEIKTLQRKSSLYKHKNLSAKESKGKKNLNNILRY